MRKVLFLILYSILLRLIIFSQVSHSTIPINRNSFSPRFEEIISNESDITVNTITAITQSSDGYLWIGTRLGVARFNGSSFFTLTKQFNNIILERDINAIVEDRNGTLWIASVRGLITYKNGHIRTTEVEKQFDKIEVRSLKIDRNGNIWVGAQTGLYKITGNNVVKIEGIRPVIIYSILVDSKNRLWAAVSSYGLIMIENGILKTYNSTSGIKDKRIFSIFEDHQGNIWFGNEAGEIIKFHNGKFELSQNSRDLKNRAIHSFAEDAQNNIWIATTGNGLLRYKNGTFQRYTSKNGLSADAIRTVFVDKENNLWIGTAGAGLNRLRDHYISTYTIRDGLPNNAVWSIYKDHKHKIWIGTGGSGICYLEGDKLFNLSSFQNSENKVARSICNDKDGNIWLGTNGNGLYKFRNGTLTSYLNNNMFQEKTIKALNLDSKGNLWIGTNHACYTYSNGKFNLFNPDANSPKNTRHILEDKSGNLWFGCGTYGLYKWDKKKIIYLPLGEDKKNNDILSLFCDEDNILWIATARGLSMIKGKKITNFPMEGILKDLMIFCCLEDDFKDLWLSTNIGVIKVNRQELINYADGKTNSFKTEFFGKDDGLLSTECNGGTQPCGMKDDDGRIWFPTMNGVAVIDPLKIKHKDTTSSNVLIESFIVNDSSANLTNNQELSANSDRLEFHFTCLSFKNSVKNRYKYMLEGWDQDWIDAGSRTTAYYTNLPYGNYKFRVIASNSNGIWNKEGASLAFTIKPTFYETIWFYIIILIFIIGTIYLIYFLRLKSLETNRKRLSKLIEEKTAQLDNELKERKLKEKELEESEQRYKFVIEGSNEAFYDWQIQNADVIFSSRWAEILEAEYDSLNGMIDSWESALHPDDKALVLENLNKHFLGETPYFEMEYRIITRKNNIRWIFDRGKVVSFDESGKPLRIAGTMQDITDKKIMEDEFLKMKKIESIGVLAGGIAHDFNNILTSILGNISLAKFKLSKNDFSKLPDLLNNSEKASFRAKDLTHQLLTFSKGGQPIIKTTLIGPLVKETFDFATHGRNIVSEFDFSEDIWPVDIDEGQITQVVQNIVINACQAMPNGGKITVQIRNYSHGKKKQENIALETGDYVKISVKDEGIGIPKEVIEKIFDPYFTTKHSGQGLGLATTYSIIKKHNGAIFVDSEIGKGSTFSFFLPRSKSEIDSNQKSSSIKNGNGRVLVMDDDEMIRDLLSEMLSGIGYKVETSKNGSETLTKYQEAFLKNKFDCVIMDLTIPGDIGGEETLGLLKKIDPEVKAIVSSGYSNNPIMAKYKEHGFIGVISKPFYLEDVSEVLSRINL